MAKTTKSVAKTENQYAPILAIDDAYRNETRWYIDFIEENGLGLIDGLAEYVDHLNKGFKDRSTGKTRAYSASAFNKRVAAVKNRIRWALRHSNQYDQINAAKLDAQLDEVKQRNKATVAVDPDDIPTPEEVEEVCSSTDVVITTRMWISFLAHTGVRVSAMLNIRQTDLRRNGKCWKITIRGKGGKDRTINCSFELMDSIQKVFDGQEYLFEHNGKQYDRNSVSNAIRAASREVLGGGARWHAHTLRHYFVTQRREAGVPLEVVSSYIGHASIATTAMIYSHVRARAEDIMQDVPIPGGSDEVVLRRDDQKRREDLKMGKTPEERVAFLNDTLAIKNGTWKSNPLKERIDAQEAEVATGPAPKKKAPAKKKPKPSPVADPKDDAAAIYAAIKGGVRAASK